MRLSDLKPTAAIGILREFAPLMRGDFELTARRLKHRDIATRVSWNKTRTLKGSTVSMEEIQLDIYDNSATLTIYPNSSQSWEYRTN